MPILSTLAGGGANRARSAIYVTELVHRGQFGLILVQAVLLGSIFIIYRLKVASRKLLEAWGKPQMLCNSLLDTMPLYKLKPLLCQITFSPESVSDIMLQGVIS